VKRIVFTILIFFVTTVSHSKIVVWECKYSDIHNLPKNEKNWKNTKPTFEVDLEKKEVLWKNLKNSKGKVLGKIKDSDIQITAYPHLPDSNYVQYWVVSFLKEQLIIDLVKKNKPLAPENVENRVIYNCEELKV